MAKITVCGDAVVVTSAMKLEDIAFVQKYRKEALVLTDDDDNPIFALSCGSCGGGEINQYGAMFTSETRDEQKLAVLTLVCPNHEGDVKEVVADGIGAYVATLNKLEAKLPEVIQEIKAERQSIMDSITIAQ